MKQRLTLVLGTLALLAATGAGCVSALAQDGGLRGGFGEDGLQDPAEAEDGRAAEPGQAGSATAAVSGTRGTLSDIGADAGEEAEALANVGRIRPVQPFSERLRAVQRRATVVGGGTAPAVAPYDGETTRDAPRGIRVGSFLLYPELFTGLGWTDNQAGDSTGSAGATYRVAPTLRVQSDWGRHSLGINFRGSYAGYPGSNLEADPSVTSDALLRLEVGDRSEIDVEARYGLALQDRGTAEATGGDQDIHELGAGLAFRRDLGLVGAELRGRVDSTLYSGAGGAVANRERDNALFTTTLRVEGNTGAFATPFAEASLLGRRYFEKCPDLTLCADRDSKGYALRAGIAFDNGGKISGDVAVGWRSETLDDKRLAKLEGLTVDGSLVWSPTRLTTVTALASTDFSPSTIAGTPGSVIYSGDIRLAHGFSDALSGEIGVGYSWRDYTGIALTEKEARATTALTWALTSNVALQGRYTFRQFSSSTAGAGYSSNTFEAGLRFRR